MFLLKIDIYLFRGWECLHTSVKVRRELGEVLLFLPHMSPWYGNESLVWNRAGS